MTKQKQKCKKFKAQLLDSILEQKEAGEQIMFSPKRLQNSTVQEDSNSCDLFWDQSSKVNVLMTKIKIVNGSKNYKNISIETRNTSVQSTSNNSFFEIFKDQCVQVKLLLLQYYINIHFGNVW
ncbi:Hypothetical_protein [Hexamita inflata]|uniref:Hypothetical_protein n=1 Tax=Hexamita inflata TaxID=28002 RepID=A0AA86QPW7_9EUKA|nr:Hypothetical protein HINF_LOCUS45883 [Hexamita inflata]CAI9958247.1 Hypothetical protein HINF_LOCUS45892 [Hexamita inflata]